MTLEEVAEEIKKWIKEREEKILSGQAYRDYKKSVGKEDSY